MSRKGLFILVTALAVSGVVSACGGGGNGYSQAPSGAATQPPATPAPEVTEKSGYDSGYGQNTAAPQATEAASPATQAPAAGGAGRTYVISAEGTEARFVALETLNGQPNTVIGATNKVEGRIVVDLANPAGATLSPIKVDLTGLATDNPFRNGAIRDRILETGNPANQFAEFVMTKLSGLPDAATIGQAVAFQITGNLTLHGVTRELTFEATVTPVSETQLKGKATLAKVAFGDFGIQILRLPPQVASVEDTLALEIEFTANAQ